MKFLSDTVYIVSTPRGRDLSTLMAETGISQITKKKINLICTEKRFQTV